MSDCLREIRDSLPEGIILLVHRGSIAHGMYVPDSDPKGIDDVDLMGVVVAPTEHYLGLTEWGSRGTLEIKQGKWDCVFYELRKLISLLLQGNPNVLSLLWTRNEDILFKTSSGTELIENRDLFTGKHVYSAFAGYAYAQMLKMESRDPAELRKYMAVDREMKIRGIHPNGKLDPPPATGNLEEKDVTFWDNDTLLRSWRSYHKKGENLGYLGDKRKQLVLEHGYDTKNAAHLIRLLRMAKEFLKTGELVVYRPDAESLLQIKKGEYTLQAVKEQAEQLFQEVKEARDHSSLPEGPDRVQIERLLIKILGSHLQFKAAANV